MIDQADIASARERIPLVDLVGRDVPLKRVGRQWVGLCPVHAERTPSFYVSPDRGRVHCFGCGFDADAIGFVQRIRNLPFDQAVRELLGMDNTASLRLESSNNPVSRRDLVGSAAGNDLDRVHAIIRESHPVTMETAAGIYLWSRGLDTHQPALRAHPALYVAETGDRLPALIAPVKDSDGHVVACQRIWCLNNMSGDAKDSRAPLRARRKVLGSMGDGAVRIAAAGPVLGLAESVEKAIACSILFKFPCWGTLGAARLSSVTLPDIVETVLIFGDNDIVGHTQAEKAYQRYSQEGSNCQLLFPEPQFKDWEDQLNGNVTC
jgi:DNA primase